MQNETNTERASEMEARIRAAFESQGVSIESSGIRGWIALRLESWSKQISELHVLKLITKRKRLMQVLNDIPKRMQLVTNQARLVLELIDDLAEGKYRGIPWHALAIAVATLLYSVSPADVVPDVLPVLGAFDDVVVMAVGMRLVRKHLRAYAEFKGYNPVDYFQPF